MVEEYISSRGMKLDMSDGVTFVGLSEYASAYLVRPTKGEVMGVLLTTSLSSM